MGAVVAEHQVGSPAVEQQVRWLEGQGEALDALTEVKGVPQIVVGGVHKKILRNKREHNSDKKGNQNILKCIFNLFKDYKTKLEKLTN